MKFLSIIFSIFFFVSLAAQESPLLFDVQQKGGSLLPELNIEAGKFLIAHHPAFKFWLMKAELSRPDKQIAAINYPNDAFVVNDTGDRILTRFNGIIHLLDTKNFTPILPTNMPGSNAFFSSDDSLCGIINGNKITLYDAHNGNEIQTIVGNSIIRCPRINQGSTLLAACTDERIITVWDLKTGLVKYRLVHENDVEQIEFNIAGTQLLTCTGDTLTIWDAKNGNRLAVKKFVTDSQYPQYHRMNIELVQFHPTKSNFILLNVVDYKVATFELDKITSKVHYTYLWDFLSNREMKWINVKNAEILSDGKILAMVLDKKAEQKAIPNCWQIIKIDFEKGLDCIQKFNYFLNEDETFYLSKDRCFFCLNSPTDVILDFNLHTISIPVRCRTIHLNRDNSQLIGCDETGRVIKMDLYDLNLKEKLLDDITIDGARFLIDSYKNFYNPAYKIPNEERNRVAFNKLRAPIQNVLVETGKVSQSFLPTQNKDIKKRKIQEITQ